MFLKLTCSHTRGFSTICQWGTKAHKRATINCLAWRMYSLQRWKQLSAVTSNPVQKMLFQLLSKLEEQ